MPPAPEPYWRARAQEQGPEYWNERADLDPLAAVIDPDGSPRKNAYVHAVHARALRGLEIAPTDSVLDFGCGTGRNLPGLAERAASVTGTDTSAQMIEIATAAVAEIDNCEVVLAESGRVPVPPESFDLVLTVLVLQMFGEDPATFAEVATEIRRVLRPGGRLAMIERVERDGALSQTSWSDRLEAAGLSLATSRLVRVGAPTPFGRLVISGALPMSGAMLTLDKQFGRVVGGRAPYVDRLMIARPA